MNKVRLFLPCWVSSSESHRWSEFFPSVTDFRTGYPGSLNGTIGSYFQIYSNGDRAVPREVIERMVDKYPEMTGYTEDIGITGYVVSMKGEELETLISAGTPERQVSNKNELLYGREYDQNDYDNASNVVVIDTYAAKKIFGRENAVGEILHFQQRRRGEGNLKAIGVRKSTRQDNEKKKDTVSGDSADNQALDVVMQDEKTSDGDAVHGSLQNVFRSLDPNELSSVLLFSWMNPRMLQKCARKAEDTLKRQSISEGEDQLLRYMSCPPRISTPSRGVLAWNYLRIRYDGSGNFLLCRQCRRYEHHACIGNRANP